MERRISHGRRSLSVHHEKSSKVGIGFILFYFFKICFPKLCDSMFVLLEYPCQVFKNSNYDDLIRDWRGLDAIFIVNICVLLLFVGHRCF